MTRCFWCNADPEEKAKRHEGPHATWCPHYRRGPRNEIQRKPGAAHPTQGHAA